MYYGLKPQLSHHGNANLKRQLGDLLVETLRPDWKKGQIGKSEENVKKKPNNSFKINSPH